MSQFMVVASFLPDTDMAEVMKVVEAEKAAVKTLQDASRLGQIRLAVPNKKVFLDVFAADESEAAATVKELPMARWWSLEVYPLSGTA